MSELRRSLGLFDVFCFASGAMISSGLFVLPGLAFNEVGPALVLSYALAGLLSLPALFSQGELASAMPKSGGTYFHIERSMGALPGTLAGLANWFAIALKAAFALVGIGTFARILFPAMTPWQMQAVAVGFCVLFGVINIFGAGHAGWVQKLVVLALLGVLAIYVAGGLWAAANAPLAERFAGFGDTGVGPVLAGAGMVFISFGGLTKVASVAEEVRDPGRTLIRGMILSVVIVTALYVAAVFVVISMLDVLEFSGPRRLAPLSISAEKFMGGFGFALLGAGAMLAFLSTANSGILTASRSPMAMSRDGLLPPFFQRVSSRFGTPHVSVLITTGLMVVLILALDLELLVKAASTMLLVLFVFTNAAVIIMRRSGLQNYRPICPSPLYPYMQIVGCGLYLLLIVGMGLVPLAVTAGFALIGTIWYILYVRSRTTRTSALVHMVRRNVAKDYPRPDLESELRDIALERDEIAHDRFDRLIQQAEIVDLPEAILAREFLAQAAQKLAPRVGVPPEQLREKFLAREEQASSVLQPGLAIPHVIVEGERIFEALIARCRGGIIFPDDTYPVHTAFVMVASRDQRNFHLRALMAIAHIVQEHEFPRRWLQAPDDENLRDLLLLSRRQRVHDV